jgi:hypothetical protein
MAIHYLSNNTKIRRITGSDRHKQYIHGELGIILQGEKREEKKDNFWQVFFEVNQHPTFFGIVFVSNTAHGLSHI